MKEEKPNKPGISRRGFVGSSLAAMVSIGIMGKNKLFGTPVRDTAEKPKIREYRTLGRTDFKVSDISFGAGSLNNPALLEAALNMGINYIDTAEHYVRGNSERRRTGHEEQRPKIRVHNDQAEPFKEIGQGRIKGKNAQVPGKATAGLCRLPDDSHDTCGRAGEA